jgi:hypothetical protein
MNTYVLVNASINPAPPVDRRVSRIRHIRAGVEAPCRACLTSYLAPAAEERPDGLGAACVAGVVLLFRYEYSLAHFV